MPVELSRPPVPASRWKLRVLLAALTLVLPGVLSLAQTPTGSKTAAVQAAPKAPAARSEESPTWKSLTPVQREALAPLSPVWGEISSNRKRKWIALSANFKSMTPHEKATLHDRMQEWATLSSATRNQARLNYAMTRDLSHEEKKARWEAYQALSPAQKQQYAAQASPSTAGAAPAVTKRTPGKFAAVPVTRSEASTSASGASAAQRAKAPAGATTP